MEDLDFVRALYGNDWNDLEEVLLNLQLEPELAYPLASRLSLNRGWRERVAAAKLIAAYRLQALVEPLIRTFASNPETHTCRAFHRMLKEFPEELQCSMRELLRDACGEGSYGEHLLSILDQTSF